MENSNKLDVVDLECVRGNRRLFSGLSCSVDSGSILHVQGPNGSGKTTLLRAICGLLQPQAGAICWQGTSIRAIWEDFCRDMLYLGHLDGIKPDLTGGENLRVAVTLAGQQLTAAAVDDVFARLGLAGLEDLPGRVLSQGQKRRVALARLFVSRVPLWVLDEPFVGLDVTAVKLLLQIIAEHLARGGLVVLTTHQEVALTAGTIQRLQLGPTSVHV